MCNNKKIIFERKRLYEKGSILKVKEDNSVNIRKTIFENLITLISIVVYSILIIFAFGKLDEMGFLKVTKISSFVVLMLTILVFEIAYKKDSGRIALYGIEALMIAINILIINNMMKRFNVSFKNYLIISISIFFIYYIFKITIIYTKDRRRYLNSLSDIKDIVK